MMEQISVKYSQVLDNTIQLFALDVARGFGTWREFRLQKCFGPISFNFPSEDEYSQFVTRLNLIVSLLEKSASSGVLELLPLIQKVFRDTFLFTR